MKTVIFLEVDEAGDLDTVPFVYNDISELVERAKRANVTIGNGVNIQDNVLVSMDCHIADYVEIKDGAKLGFNVLLEKGSLIGPGAEVGSHSVIKEGAIVGPECEISENSVVEVGDFAMIDFDK